MNKKEFMDNVMKFNKPVLREGDCVPARLYDNHYWYIQETDGLMRSYCLPAVYLSRRQCTVEGIKAFDKRLEKAREKYKRWLAEAIASKEVKGE